VAKALLNIAFFFAISFWHFFDNTVECDVNETG